MTQTKLKEELFKQCQIFVDKRLKAVQNVIEEIQQSLNSETKSSAGDKHETGRAMLQLEREKAGQQLAEIQKLNQLLSKIERKNSKDKIGLGSIVFTTKANYFITISAGEIKTDGQVFFAISANTPIAKLLLSKHIGDTVVFRDQVFEIISII